MRGFFLLAPILASGCDLSMARQGADRGQASADRWSGGSARAAPPEGTVAADQPARDAALASPPPLTAALINRGQERYGIYCAVCHGALGDGDGKIVRRGFPAPLSFHATSLVSAPPAYVVDVITP